MTVLKNKKDNLVNTTSNVLTNVNSGRLIRPTFQLFDKPSGVNNLSAGLEINGTIVNPTFRYKLGDADGTDLNYWGYGEDLTAAGSGGSFSQGSPGLGPNDDSANPAGSRYWQASGNTFANVSTDDVAIEGVAEATGTTCVLFAKRNAGVGYEVGIDASDRIYLTVEDSSGSTTVVSAALTSVAFNHFCIFADRSGSAQIYVNGSASGAAVAISGRALTLDSATALTVGADSAGATIYDKRVCYLSLWNSAAWLDTHLQATIAAQRAAQFWGYWPNIAAGTKAPTTATRAFPAYLDKLEGSERKLYYVGSEALRMCYRQDANGANVRGYLAETQNENLLTYSEDFSTWTLLDAGDTVNDETTECPDGRTAAGEIISDTDDVAHGFRQQPTLTAATYAYSGYFKPGDNDWIWIVNVTIANCGCYFNVANGTKGTEGANCKGYIEGPFNNGFYRACIVFTGTAAVHDLRIYTVAANNDTTFQGDGSTQNLYIWGAQVEQSDYMTSPIITSGATATRLKDQLQFVAGDNIGGEDVGQGTVIANIFYPSYDCQAAKYLLNVSDGGAAADRFFIYTDSDESQKGGTRATGGDNGGCATTGDSVDNQKHSIRFIWETDDLRQAIDGTFGSADTTADMPDDLDTMDVGQNYVAGAQFNGLIQNIRIYPEPTEEG